jgi:hypothetical protein
MVRSRAAADETHAIASAAAAKMRRAVIPIRLRFLLSWRDGIARQRGGQRGVASRPRRRRPGIEPESRRGNCPSSTALAPYRQKENDK